MTRTPYSSSSSWQYWRVEVRESIEMLELTIHDLLDAFETLLVLLDVLIGASLVEYSACRQLHIIPGCAKLEILLSTVVRFETEAYRDWRMRSDLSTKTSFDIRSIRACVRYEANRTSKDVET